MVPGYNSDPMLWLYNEEGTLLYSIDDSIGLQSYISMEVPAGRYRLRAGICCNNPDGWHTNGGWNLQYELAFNGNPAMTSTTEETTTTTTSTSTTSTTSTTPTSTTTLPPTTTSTSTTTTSTTTTTVPPTTTSTTHAPATSTTTTTSTEPPTTTTSTTVPEPTTTSTSQPPATTTTTTTLPIPEIPTADLSSDEAEELATSSEVLQTVTAEQATEIFEAIDESTLTPEQGAEIVAAVQDAPTEVRAAFEEEIDIFGSGAVDTYVPIGSTIPVSERRTLLAVVGAVMSLTPIATRKKQ